MKRVTLNRFFSIAFTCITALVMANGLQSCSKKTNASKASLTAGSEPAATATATTPAAAPEEIKDGMQIKRDASGNYVIQLVIKDMQPVKLMKPAKEGYVVWIVNETNTTTSIGTIEGANTWTDKKDKTTFEATSALKPTKIFITAETDLKTEKPGTQVVWSTKNF